MTLEEVIQQLETDVNSELDHTQVLEWLQELKRSRESMQKKNLKEKRKNLKPIKELLD